MAEPRRTHLPPDTATDVDEAFRRLERLERPDPTEPAGVDPTSMPFVFPGLIYPDISTPWEHPTGGFLIRARCRLNVAGSTDTVLEFARNGAVVDPIMSSGGAFGPDGTPIPGTDFVELDAAVIPAGQTISVVFFHAGRFAPDVDALTIEVVEAGTGASGLTVRTDWGDGTK